MTKQYKKRKFIDFLHEYFSEYYPALLDDDLPDKFDAWLENYAQDNLIRLSDLFASEQYIAGIESIINNK